MSTYVILLTHGLMLGWNRAPVPPEGFDKGWRPYVWTRRVIDAEQFGSREGATKFASAVMPHQDWSVVCIVAGEDCA